ncbi:endoribonuclease YbeY-like isoform X2 [Hypanus sabinus]|uniref:endoribonuclease YbeY-like isoform X2 n=1 Tax=Hypanus sabinus TaxID=79690 RepID=UPI0028C3881C|nr:endoribonuclease YbeY-like isoform X2 [Hypanus sabinus]
MALLIRDLQRAVPLRRARLRRDCQILRQILGVGRFDLGLICVDDRRMRILNGRYRGRDAATDVLSFPFHPVRPGFECWGSGRVHPSLPLRSFHQRRFDLGVGDMPKPLHQDEYNLGDIFLGVEYIYRQSQVTTLHGICHLLGYRHSTETEWKQMFQRESNTLQLFNRLTGSNLQPLTQNSF